MPLWDTETLLGRPPCRAAAGEAEEWLKGKTVLITGGGGSIGSELCRQAAALSPRRIVVLEISENNAVAVCRSTAEEFPQAVITAAIASVRDADAVKRVFDRYRPQIVLHTAAHKHVPLMEDAPAEAVKNNVFGTRNVLGAAAACGVQQFILISTDKAVRPVCVMGQTKYLCELLCRAWDGTNQMRCSTVRFGNVLGSSGSVLPLFERQIERGGPVTVTDPDVTRYFMTIPEAASLVLRAGARARGMEAFALSMGEPIRIETLARRLISLSGRETAVQYTGLRPGEKLEEEPLVLPGTPCGEIICEPQKPVSRKKLEACLRPLRRAAARGDDKRCRELLSAVCTEALRRSGES